MTKRIDLMIVGAQKSGSTSLFRYLSEHPGIHTHPQSEMSFFMNDHEYGEGYDKTFSRYFTGFPSGNRVLLAKHAMAMYSEAAIKRIHSHNPEIHVAVVLRNPVARAYSAYWYARRNGWEDARTFEDALDREEARLKEGWLKWRNCAYTLNGCYFEHIARLHDTFSKSRVHVFLSEDLHKDPLAVCVSMLEKFDLGEGFAPDVGRRHNTAGMARSQGVASVFAWLMKDTNPVRAALRIFIPSSVSHRLRKGFLELNEKDFSPPPMNLETKRRLIAAFREHNDRLAAILDRNLDNWNG